MKELFFQLLSRLGAELPPNEGQNPIAQALRTDPYTPDDEPYLRQFMGIPKNGGLIPADLRPSKLTVNDNLPWFRPSQYPFPEGPLQNSNGMYSTPIDTSRVDNLKPGQILDFENAKAWPGLGHFKASISKSEAGNPFLSVYDKWDFDSPVISPLMERLMNKAGKGFHVYERYPLQKTSGGYQRAGDIELPEDH